MSGFFSDFYFDKEFPLRFIYSLFLIKRGPVVRLEGQTRITTKILLLRLVVHTKGKDWSYINVCDCV